MQAVHHSFRNLAVRVVLATLAGMPMASAAANDTDPSRGRPNVLFIVSDDQHWHDYGFMGHEHLRTPHLEAWPTLPRLLASVGYRIFQSGKWWQGSFARGGFDEGMTHGERHGDDGLAIGRSTLEPVFDFIDRCHRERDPFFVWYAPMPPHTPHDPPVAWSRSASDELRSRLGDRSNADRPDGLRGWHATRPRPLVDTGMAACGRSIEAVGTGVRGDRFQGWGGWFPDVLRR